ncbi:MAG: aminoglycoside phosphotransferase family protein [Deltaproteobacteria bacterium]|nr:aminoglycoside phosphotransferase family protein [Deltaproteobacteria bacterium]
MDEEKLRTELGASLWRLVTAVGAPLVTAEEITVVPANGMRKTYRLRFADGQTLKGRSFRTPVLAEVARRIHERAGVSLLARLLAHRGEAVLEEWIAGEVLVQGRVGPALLQRAGQTLGSLHRCPPPATDDLDFHPLDIQGWARKTAENLRALRDRGSISSRRADRLRQLVRSCMPSTATLGVVHRDLCPENLLTDPSGRLVSVDNGSLTIGTIDEDLCRVWYRWPMNAEEQRAFVDGYREYGDPAGFRQPSPFWVMVVMIDSARARLGVSASMAATVLHRFDQFLAEKGYECSADLPIRGSA